MTQRIKCQRCDAMILPATAKVTGGICMPCHQKMISPLPPPLPTRERLPRQLANPDGLNLEAAVSGFLELGRGIQTSNPITGRAVLERVLAWYREVRIVGAALDEDADMLLLQWGSTQLHVLSEPTDMRHHSDKKWLFTQQRHRYLDFTRQVFPTSDDGDEEFDDVAVHLSITLAFESADGSEPASNIWIGNPDRIEEATKAFMTPFVKTLIDKPASIIAIWACNCG